MRTELLFPIIRILLYLVHGVGMGFKVVAFGRSCATHCHVNSTVPRSVGDARAAEGHVECRLLCSLESGAHSRRGGGRRHCICTDEISRGSHVPPQDAFEDFTMLRCRHGRSGHSQSSVSFCSTLKLARIPLLHSLSHILHQSHGFRPVGCQLWLTTTAVDLTENRIGRSLSKPVSSMPKQYESLLRMQKSLIQQPTAAE
mmetsp:Transcript_10091/g.24391  ORF Transcript_10091/g.24391 Transcript_10091/m.24391 type:complete len:200 (+) Transcript_10091:180-779(+)